MATPKPKKKPGNLTATSLVEKGMAYVNSAGKLVITDPKAKIVLKQIKKKK